MAIDSLVKTRSATRSDLLPGVEVQTRSGSCVADIDRELEWYLTPEKLAEDHELLGDMVRTWEVEDGPVPEEIMAQVRAMKEAANQEAGYAA